MLNLRINIYILYMSCCNNPNFTKVNEEYICLNCLHSETITDNESDDCCDNMNINQKWYLY